MAFFNLSMLIFSAPSRVFDAIKEGDARWWRPWIVMSVIYVLSSYFGLPIQKAVMQMNPMDLAPALLDQQLADVDKYGLAQLALVPFGMLIYSVLFATISYVFVSVLAVGANFKKYFTLTMYTGIVGSLAQVIGVAVVRLRGLDGLRVPEDAVVSVSLRFLAPAEGVFYKALMSSFEFFTMWSFALIGMGLMRIFGLSRDRAIICVLPLWILLVIFLYLNLKFNGFG